MIRVRQLNLPQGSPEWLLVRRNAIGASEHGAIAGLSRYKRPGQVWAAKLGRWKPGKRELWQEIGHMLERPVAQLWAQTAGAELQPGPVLAEVGGRLLASLDLRGTMPAGDRRVQIIEDTKVRFLDVAPDGHLWSETSYPEDIRRQLLAGADLLERFTGERVELGVCVALLINRYGPVLRHYVVERTPEVRDEWNDLLAPAARAWWGWVETETPPPDATIDDVALVASEASEVIERTPTDDEMALVAKLVAAKVEAKAARAALSAAVAREEEEASRVARALGPKGCWPGVVGWVPGRRYTRPAVEVHEKPQLKLSRRVG